MPIVSTNAGKTSQYGRRRRAASDTTPSFGLTVRFAAALRIEPFLDRQLARRRGVRRAGRLVIEREQRRPGAPLLELL
jgi:hypothetical protein